MMVDTRNAMLVPWMLACSWSMVASDELVTAVDTDTMTAVPSEPATWRNVLLTEVPWLMRRSSSAFMPQVLMGMFTSDMENMRTV